MATQSRRRPPTPEQQQKAAERRERFKTLAKAVGDMTDDERASFSARLGTVITCEGHALSLHNTCLTLLQCPTASMVGGFWQWKNAGRAVQKGEHGLMIWIPKGKGKEAEEPTGDGPAERPGFIMGTVFDISQTQPLEGGAA